MYYNVYIAYVLLLNIQYYYRRGLAITQPWNHSVKLRSRDQGNMLVQAVGTRLTTKLRPLPTMSTNLTTCSEIPTWSHWRHQSTWPPSQTKSKPQRWTLTYPWFWVLSAWVWVSKLASWAVFSWHSISAPEKVFDVLEIIKHTLPTVTKGVTQAWI